MNEIIEIAKKIEKVGGRLYLVGGAVRDEFLNRPVFEEDYCVTGMTKEEFQEIFPEAKLKGKAFPVFEWQKREFALARKERKIGEGHNGFQIETNPKITIEEDLQRRDITINSIAKDVLTHEIIDPYQGRKDLEKKILRATSKSFLEDPLRIYRVARFAAILEFEVEKKMMQQMKEGRKELKSLAPERVFEEFRKALMAQKPSIFFEVLKKADLLSYHFQEIEDLVGALQPEKYHPEGDAFAHTMLALNHVSEETKSLEIRFATLVHDFGKGTTPKEEYPHHYGHEMRGEKLMETFSDRLKIPNLWRNCGKTACLEHMRGGIFDRMKPAKKVVFLERVAKTNLGLEGLQMVVYADKLSGGRKTEKEKICFAEIGKKMLQEVNGTEIQRKFGIQEGILLKNKLQEERIDWMKKQFS